MGRRRNKKKSFSENVPPAGQSQTGHCCSSHGGPGHHAAAAVVSTAPEDPGVTSSATKMPPAEQGYWPGNKASNTAPEQRMFVTTSAYGMASPEDIAVPTEYVSIPPGFDPQMHQQIYMPYGFPVMQDYGTFVNPPMQGAMFGESPQPGCPYMAMGPHGLDAAHGNDTNMPQDMPYGHSPVEDMGDTGTASMEERHQSEPVNVGGAINDAMMEDPAIIMAHGGQSPQMSSGLIGEELCKIQELASQAIDECQDLQRSLSNQDTDKSVPECWADQVEDDMIELEMQMDTTRLQDRMSPERAEVVSSASFMLDAQPQAHVAENQDNLVNKAKEVAVIDDMQQLGQRAAEKVIAEAAEKEHQENQRAAEKVIADAAEKEHQENQRAAEKVIADTAEKEHQEHQNQHSGADLQELAKKAEENIYIENQEKENKEANQQIHETVPHNAETEIHNDMVNMCQKFAQRSVAENAELEYQQKLSLSTERLTKRSDEGDMASKPVEHETVDEGREISVAMKEEGERYQVLNLALLQETAFEERKAATEEPKKHELSKQEPNAADEPKHELPKQEQNSAEKSKHELSKQEPNAADEPKHELPKQEQNSAEKSKHELPKHEQNSAEEPKHELPKHEQNSAGEPKLELPQQKQNSAETASKAQQKQEEPRGPSWAAVVADTSKVVNSHSERQPTPSKEKTPEPHNIVQRVTPDKLQNPVKPEERQEKVENAKQGQENATEARTPDDATPASVPTLTDEEGFMEPRKARRSRRRKSSRRSESDAEQGEQAQTPEDAGPTNITEDQPASPRDENGNQLTGHRMNIIETDEVSTQTDAKKKTITLDIESQTEAGTRNQVEVEAVAAQLMQEKSQRLAGEGIIKILESETEQLRMQLATLQQQHMLMENDYIMVKGDFMEEKRLASEYKRRCSDLEYELDSRRSEVYILQKELQEKETLSGGIDYMLELKEAKKTAEEADATISALENQLKQSQNEVQKLRDQLELVNKAQSEMIALDKHQMLLQRAEDRAIQSEMRILQLQTEMLALQNSQRQSDKQGQSWAAVAAKTPPQSKGQVQENSLDIKDVPQVPVSRPVAPELTSGEESDWSSMADSEVPVTPVAKEPTESFTPVAPAGVTPVTAGAQKPISVSSKKEVKNAANNSKGGNKGKSKERPVLPPKPSVQVKPKILPKPFVAPRPAVPPKPRRNPSRSAQDSLIESYASCECSTSFDEEVEGPSLSVLHKPRGPPNRRKPSKLKKCEASVVEAAQVRPESGSLFQMASIPPIDYSGLPSHSIGFSRLLSNSRKRKWEGGDGYGMTDEEDVVTREIDPQMLNEDVIRKSTEPQLLNGVCEQDSEAESEDAEDDADIDGDSEDAANTDGVSHDDNEDFTEAFQKRVEKLCQQFLTDVDAAEDYQDAEDDLDEAYEDAENDSVPCDKNIGICEAFTDKDSEVEKDENCEESSTYDDDVDDDEENVVGQRNRDSGYMDSDEEGFEYCLEDIDNGLQQESEEREFTDAAENIESRSAPGANTAISTSKENDVDENTDDESSDEEVQDEFEEFEDNKNIRKWQNENDWKEVEDNGEWEGEEEDEGGALFKDCVCPQSKEQDRKTGSMSGSSQQDCKKTEDSQESDDDFWPENIFDDEPTGVVTETNICVKKLSENLCAGSNSACDANADVEESEADSDDDGTTDDPCVHKTTGNFDDTDDQKCGRDCDDGDGYKEGQGGAKDGDKHGQEGGAEDGDKQEQDSDMEVKVFAKGSVAVQEESDEDAEETDTADEDEDAEPSSHRDYTFIFVSVIIAILAVLVYAIFVNICMLTATNYNSDDNILLQQTQEPEASQSNISNP